jgi:hypothetical protein
VGVLLCSAHGGVGGVRVAAGGGRGGQRGTGGITPYGVVTADVIGVVAGVSGRSGRSFTAVVAGFGGCAVFSLAWVGEEEGCDRGEQVPGGGPEGVGEGEGGCRPCLARGGRHRRATRRRDIEPCAYLCL